MSGVNFSLGAPFPLTFRLFSLALIFTAIQLTLQAQDAESILHAARLNPTSRPAVLRAQIRGEGAPAPLTIRLKDHLIRYEFTDPDQTILLKLDPTETKLSEKLKGTTKPLPPERLHDSVRDTGVTYEDLSLGFLYWPRPVLQGEETVKTRSCWKIDLQAPSSEPLYGVARVWIDKQSGAILRIEGYDKNGLLLRRFEIVSAQKIDGLWMLKQMRIESFKPGYSDPISRRYLEVLGKE
jgi:hypothetical protein